ncbi:hypothetical protein GCM10020331_050300 [Ectobacillus funiculus]
MQRYSRALVAVNVKKNGDEVVDVLLTDGNQELVLITHSAYALRFHEGEASAVGVRAAGVKGMNVKEDDYVVSGLTLQSADDFLILVTQRGGVKKMKVSEIELSSRAKRGHLIFKELKANPYRIVGVEIADDAYRMFVKLERRGAEELDIQSLKEKKDRYSNGTLMIDVNEAGTVTEVWKVAKQEG